MKKEKGENKVKNSLKEMVLLLLSNNKNKWFNSAYIRQWLNANSIGYLGLISAFELRQMIKNLRFGGHPIIAGKKGYSYTNDKVELQEYITSRKLELESELNILRKMEGKW